MKTPKNVLCFFMMAMAIVMISCSAEDGTDGKNGIDGVDGEPGLPGEPGTANVIYSDWLGADFEAGIATYGAIFPAPELTEEILNTGEIGVYMRHLNSSGEFDYRKLNYTLTVAGTTEFILAFPHLGEISIAASMEADAPDYGFRYVLIPGGTEANAIAKGLDLENFEEVAEVFNIPLQ